MKFRHRENNGEEIWRIAEKDVPLHKRTVSLS